MATNYVRDMMAQCLNDGVNDELREMAAKDATLFDHLGVESERQRNLALYLDFFLDDLATEMERSLPGEREKVIMDAFHKLRDKEDVDLTDIRRAVHTALGGRTKSAYHNISGLMGGNQQPQRDISKWVRTLGAVLAAQRTGQELSTAVERLTADWSPNERMDFHYWMRFYTSSAHEKYGLRSTAAQQEEEKTMAPAELLRREMRQEPLPQQPQGAETAPVRRKRGRPPRTAPKSLQERKNFIVGRLDAIRRELRHFSSVWPTHVWQPLYQALADLEQQIVSLKTESSLRDCIIRTAAIWEKHGVHGGARMLEKMAQPPEGDVVSEIEKALTGREYETTPEPAAPAAEQFPSEDIGGPAEVPAEAPAGMPAGALEELPEPPPPPKAEPEKEEPKREEKPEQKERKKRDSDENPFSGASVRDVIHVLEPLARQFKARENVRQLSRADMMMDALGISSYFSEIGEAIARLIETDSYVGSRLEKAIGKLRGGLGGQGGGAEGDQQPPAIEMEPPAGVEETAVEAIEERPGVEETAAEVVEPPAAPAEETAAEVTERPPVTAPGA